MTDLHKLLPCPFCQREPQSRLGITDGERWVGVRCEEHTQWIPIEQWNRRAALAEPQEQNAEDVRDIITNQLIDSMATQLTPPMSPASAAPDCNCHPEDYPPVPCQHKRSYSECMRAALASAQEEIAALKRPGYVAPDWVAEIDALYEKATKEATTGDSLMFNNIVMPNDAITELKWKLVKDWPKIRPFLRPGCVSVPVEPTMGQWDDFCAVFPVPFDKFIEAYKAALAASGEGKP